MKKKFNDHRAEMAIKRAKARAGTAWGMLGSDLRESLLCRELCFLILSNSENPGHERAAAMISEAIRAFGTEEG